MCGSKTVAKNSRLAVVLGVLPKTQKKTLRSSWLGWTLTAPVVIDKQLWEEISIFSNLHDEETVTYVLFHRLVISCLLIANHQDKCVLFP